MDWVKKVKRDKVQDRLVVVTRYRLISIARGSFGGKTVRCADSAPPRADVFCDNVFSCRGQLDSARGSSA